MTSKKYLIPESRIMQIGQEAVFCTSTVPTDGTTNEQFNSPTDWGGSWE